MLEHKCEICGRMSKNKLKCDGKIVCNKHYKQFHKYGYFRDTSSRTRTDKNNIIVQNDIAKIELYDKFYNIVAYAIIDAEDINKVKNIKWHLNNCGYCVYSGNRAKTQFLHRVILGVNCTVDHINGDKLDNRKCNLRSCTPSTNQMNVSQYKGYYYMPEKQRWYAKIKLHGKQLNLAWFATKEEAEYCRWYAERIVFKEYAADKVEPKISAERKKEIQELVKRKVQRL